MSKKWINRLSIPLLASTLLVAGCTTTEKAATTVEKKAIEGGTLVMASNQEPDTLDIQQVFSGDEPRYQAYEPLFHLDHNGKVVPGLAQEYSVSEDGKVWTIVLKEGPKYHSGAPVDAESVAKSLNRFRDNKSGLYAMLFGSFEKAEAVDKKTVKAYFTEPFAPFLASITSYWISPVDPVVVDREGENFKNKPSGAGPFKFVEQQRGSSVTYEKNPDYAWGPEYSKNKNAPHIDKLTFRFIKDPQTRVLEFKKGTIQILRDVQPAFVKELESVPGVTLNKYTNAALNYIGLNTKKPQLSDVRVRQAISMTVDREEIIKGAMEGYAEPAYSPFAPKVPYWSEKVEQEARKMYKKDIEKSKQLLADAGWKDTNGNGIVDKDGKELTTELYIIQEQIWERSAQIVQSQLKQIGIDVKIKPADLTTVVKQTQEGVHDMVLFSYGWNDPDILYIILGKGTKQIGIEDAKLEELFHKGKTTVQPEARAKIYEELQRLISEQAGMVPLNVPQVIDAYHDIDGYMKNPYMFNTIFSDIQLKK